jgi:hypothetical protein
MKKMKKIYLLLVLCTFILSCTSNDESKLVTNNTILTSKDSIKHEISLLIGKTIIDKNAREEFLKITAAINDNRNSISLAALLNSTENISVHEKRMIQSKYQNKSVAVSSFKERFNYVLNSEKKNTPAINNLKSKNSTTNKGVFSLFNELAKENLEIVIPYLEDFDMNDTNEISVTYDPEIRDDWNIGTKFEYNDQEILLSEVDVIIDDEYAYEK